MLEVAIQTLVDCQLSARAKPFWVQWVIHSLSSLCLASFLQTKAMYSFIERLDFN